jgi:hypothetical protein
MPDEEDPDLPSMEGEKDIKDQRDWAAFIYANHLKWDPHME